MCDAPPLQRIGLTIARGVGWLALAMCAGCSNLDFQRSPIGAIADRLDSGKPYVAETESSNRVDAARADRLQQVLLAWRGATQSAEVYRIGAADVLEITVHDLEEVGKASVLSATVGENGAVSVPMAGEVPVEGLTTDEVARRVVEAYRGRYIRNPQVSVRVAEYRSAPIIVTGAVVRPGIHYLKRGGATLLEMLVEAGGLATLAGDVLWVLRMDATTNAPPAPDADWEQAVEDGADAAPTVGQTIRVDLRALLDEGDARLNLPLQRGDIVNVPHRKLEYINVLGYVRGPGRIQVDKGQEITALNALATVGGPAPSARVENSYLIRPGADGNQMVKVDLSKIARGIRPDFHLRAGDTLVVGSGLLMKFFEIFKVGGSATYTYTPMPP